jgi:hypothetical protein
MAAAAALPPLNLYGKMKSFFNPGCFAMSPFCFLGDWGKTPATLDVIGLGQWVCVSCSVCGFLCLCEQQKCKHFFRHAYHDCEFAMSWVLILTHFWRFCLYVCFVQWGSQMGCRCWLDLLSLQSLSQQ